ncbi:helix-turn-helix domain-containing protein [Paenibacillus sp.]
MQRPLLKINRFSWNALVLIVCAVALSTLCFWGIEYYIQQRTIDQLTDSAVVDTQEYLNRYSTEISTKYQNNWLRLTSRSFVSAVRALISDDVFLSDSAARYARMLSIQDEIKKHFTFDNLFSDVAIMIVTEDNVYLCGADYISDNLQSDYMNGIFSFSGMDWDAFLYETTKKSNRYLTENFITGHLSNKLNKYDANSILSVARYSLHSSEVGIYAILHINTDEVRENLRAFHYIGDHFSLTQNEKVIYSSHPDLHILENDDGLWHDGISDTLYLDTPLGISGLSCYVSLDHETIHGTIRHFTHLLGIIPYVFFVFIVILTLLLFFRWQYPVVQIAHSIPGQSETTALRQIHSHITMLQSEKQRYESRISVLEPLAKKNLLKRVYSLEPLSEANLSWLRMNTGLSDGSELRCIAIGCLDAKKNTEKLFASITPIITEYLPFLIAEAEIDHRFVAILPFSDVPDELQNLLDKLNSSFDSAFAIGISDTFVGIASISSAYEEALARWKDALLWQNSSINASFIDKENRYRVDYDSLNTLYRSLLKGDIDLTMQTFDTLVQQNFYNTDGKPCKQLFCQQFYYDIVGTMARISTQHSVADILNRLFAHSQGISLDEQLFLLRNALQECCESIPIKVENNSLREEVLAFCQDRFVDPAMSLTMIAEYFHLSESSMSKFIKMHTGFTFSAYIESLRIHRAEELLLHGSLSVHAISENIGYVNTTTFYNAFKRKHNCTPTQWLKLHETQTGSMI